MTSITSTVQRIKLEKIQCLFGNKKVGGTSAEGASIEARKALREVERVGRVSPSLPRKGLGRGCAPFPYFVLFLGCLLLHFE